MRWFVKTLCVLVLVATIGCTGSSSSQSEKKADVPVKPKTGPEGKEMN